VSGPWAALRPYFEKESLAAFAVGVSSGFPYAMIGATLTTRLAQDGIDKRTVTAFTLAFLVYNLKVFWAWIVDGVRIPLLGRLGQRVSWLLLSGAAVIAAVVNLALVDPAASIQATIVAAVLVGIAGATYDIVIDAYRIETLQPYQLGIGSGMSQYGWRIGAAAAGALALVVAERRGWAAAYIACAAFALPAMLTGLVVGEPARHVVASGQRGIAAVWKSISGPFAEFLRRSGAWLVLLFILVHKIGDTLANLTLRLLFDELGYSTTRSRCTMSVSASGRFSSASSSVVCSTRGSGCSARCWRRWCSCASRTWALPCSPRSATAIRGSPRPSASRTSPVVSAASSWSRSSPRCATCSSPRRSTR
jgi:PAT family beta-lactamase induction signal transducer AmpG